MKVYTLSEASVEDEQKTVTISETKEVTAESKTSVAQLKEKHESLLAQIVNIQIQADVIVDELTDINTNTTLEVSNIPTKLITVK